MPTNQASAGHLLKLIRSGQATTRGELQAATGLSRSTVGHRLDQLFHAGWLRNTAGTSTGGRPSVRLEFDARHAVVLAVDLDTTHGRAAVTDLAGTVLAEHTRPLLISDGPDKVLDAVGSWLPALLGAAEVEAGAVCGIGLSVPGPVDWETGTVVQPPVMPGWDGHPVQSAMQAAFARHVGAAVAPPPVLVDNDANLMAYGEQRHHYPDCSAFALIKVSAGIGAGVVVGGEPYRGIDGGAGDIGHIRLHDRQDALCMCGSYGCLGAVASGRAIAEQLTALGIPAPSATEVREHLAAGQPDAVRLAREAGQRVGEVLVTVVTLLNPGVLVIAGDLACTPFLTGVRELLYQRAMPRTTAHLTVATSELGDRAALAGAAAMVVEHLYSPEIADARLAAAGGT
ncbi:ROK family transcriptional regulator [Streptomyces wuyuanensis]|uniref:Sugar kinase of the NBD/HSP70 family, may contain an N-terminal HTH domain n=1 Tax=Streptomyces wuyuanensis TaxID=1196353 RepID=A0A1G9Z0Y8_9ACTN|nr:ROK family transcriptional regulator [Streptomyces wuyuanensis]SDN15032.1 Sugar kinase of the NBD/HSP70 family, may contain an N-terminal HTH domain [Streptomyces wuyuanensis]